jgi:uncharacterized protein (DUF2235 family)
MMKHPLIALSMTFRHLTLFIDASLHTLSTTYPITTYRSFRDHVCAGYKFLSNHYRKGDNIYIFGFSRGTFARWHVDCFSLCI